MDLSMMGVNEWLLIAAAIAGPVLAVQAQKAVERTGAKAARRDKVFTVLMATRQSRLSSEHVQALNSIDLAFYGWRILGRPVRRAKDQAVVDAWNTYRRHLSPAPNERPKDQAAFSAWNARGDELFVNLLEVLAAANNYAFQREDLKTGSYSPEAHGHLEAQAEAIRAGLLAVLNGERSIPFAISSWPIDPTAAAQQHQQSAQMAEAMERIAEGLSPSSARNAPTPTQLPMTGASDDGPPRI